MWDVTGRPVTPPNEKFAVWTHPRETPGQLEFAIIERNTIDPRLQPAWSKEYWREHHPLGIEHASHITTVVRDLDAAKKFYCDILGGKLIHRARDAGPQNAAPSSRSAKIPSSSSRSRPPRTRAEARDLEKNGEGVHALTFKTRNVARAVGLFEIETAQARAGGRKISLGRDQCFGMVIGFTERPIPGDPRDN